MKKIFLFATMAVAAILASCSENIDINPPETIHVDGAQIQLSLGESSQTRAFFDGRSTPEPWEQEIKTLSVYVFDAAGDFVLKHTLSPGEITAKATTFKVPFSLLGTVCSFYAVANTDYGDMATVSAMENIKETVTLDQYNGTFAEVTGGSKREAGFVMNGSTKIKIEKRYQPTRVGLTLTRTVAKVACRISMDAAIKTGTLTIGEVKLYNATTGSWSFPQKGSWLDARNPAYEHTQLPNVNGSYHENLFYIYEQGITDNYSDGLSLVFSGYYDHDGDPATTDDRTEVRDRVISLGGILRNGSYRVNVVMKNIVSNAVTVNYETKDWTPQNTQEHQI